MKPAAYGYIGYCVAAVINLGIFKCNSLGSVVTPFQIRKWLTMKRLPDGAIPRTFVETFEIIVKARAVPLRSVE
jgi:hypothetical protein